MTLLQIAADRSDHYSGIARSISSISSRMAALAQQFAVVAPRSEADEAWIDLLIASASSMLQSANDLKTIEYAPPSTTVDPLTGFPIVNGYPQNPETGLYHSAETGLVLDPQPEIIL